MLLVIGDPGEEYDYVDSVGIVLAVLIIVMVKAIINYNKDAQFRSLQQQLQKQLTCLVVRNGDVSQHPVSDIVVGDICVIKCGN